MAIDLDNLFVRQKGLCCYCERKMRLLKGYAKTLEPDRATREHLQRKSDGGSNANDNIAAACFECNSGRGSMDWFTYKSYKMNELFV